MSHLTFEDSENDELCDTARDDRPLLLADVTSVTVQLRTNDKPYKINNLSERIFQYSSNRKGGIFNSRDYRKSHAEKWGRIHWGILSIGIFSIIYFCFTLGAWVDERPAQIVVNIPPVDDSLPSPRGNFFCQYYFNKITTFLLFLYHFPIFTSTTFDQIKFTLNL